MARVAPLESVLLPGARALLERHARELPQRDDLCGAFCGALALNAAGLEQTAAGEPLDQDAVALAAGSIVSLARDRGHAARGRDRAQGLPPRDPHDRGPRDLRHDRRRRRAGDRRALRGRGRGARLRGTVDGGAPARVLRRRRRAASARSRSSPTSPPITCGAGARRRPQLLGYLYDGELDGPPPDWDVGHFACIVARTEGPGGRLYAVADTYPALGDHGVHLQPEERLAAAIARPDKPAGGVIAAVASEDAAALREAAAALGLEERLWDNGTIAGQAA